MQATIATAPYRIHRYPTQWIESWELRNGRRATLRPVLPQDDGLTRAFVGALSATARRNRFHGALNGLSEARAQEMTQIDYQRHMGFVITVTDGDEEVVIADGRYVLGEDGECAEFGVVVADAWQGLGLGKRLIAALCKCAHRAGARWLCGDVLAGNRDMLALVERCGFNVRESGEDDAVLHVERSVAAEMPAARRSANESTFGALGHTLAAWLSPKGAARGR